MKRTLLIICTLLCANVLSAQTYDGAFYVEDLIYAYNNSDQTAVVYGYDYENPPTNAVIYESVIYQGITYNVVGIAGSAFTRTYTENGWENLSCTTLTSVTIPNSVTSIGNSAFFHCSSLTSVTIPNSVTSIGNSAFGWCSSLTSVTIGNSVTSIGEGAFSHCYSLISIDIPNSVTYIGEAAFLYCNSLISVSIPNSITSIKNNLFQNCSSLTSVTIPNSVISIGNFAFAYCFDLTSVNIPNNITSIGGYAFSSCSSLTSVTIPNSVTSIGGAAFHYCTGLESINLSDNITSIGRNCFDSCINLTTVNIPTSLSVIDTSLFRFCTSLTSITIPENITDIKAWSFWNCHSLTSINIPNSVTSIEYGAFGECSSLSSVTCLANTPPSLGSYVFYNTPSNKTLNVNCGLKDDYISSWTDFYSYNIHEIPFVVNATANNETFGSVAVESDCSTGTLTATANEGYRFVIWNDGNTDNPRTVALTSDTAFTAIFALIDESSLAEDVEFAEISLYPNPTSSKVSFNQTIEKVEVIDLSGKTLFTFSNANSINIESLPSGAYYLRLTNNDKAIMQKIIKE